MTEFNREIVACMSCLAPNGISTAFCESCGSPLGTTSTLDPVKTIRAESFLLQKAVSARPKFIVLLGVWVIFLPWLLISGGIAVNQLLYPDGFASFVFFWIGVGLSFVAVKILFSVTSNYLTMADSTQT